MGSADGDEAVWLYLLKPALRASQRIHSTFWHHSGRSAKSCWWKFDVLPTKERGLNLYWFIVPKDYTRPVLGELEDLLTMQWVLMLMSISCHVQGFTKRNNFSFPFTHAGFLCQGFNKVMATKEYVALLMSCRGLDDNCEALLSQSNCTWILVHSFRGKVKLL